MKKTLNYGYTYEAGNGHKKPPPEGSGQKNNLHDNGLLLFSTHINTGDGAVVSVGIVEYAVAYVHFGKAFHIGLAEIGVVTNHFDGDTQFNALSHISFVFRVSVFICCSRVRQAPWRVGS